MVAGIAILVLLALNILALLKLRRWVIDPRRAGLSWVAVLVGNPVVCVAALDYLAIDFARLEHGSKAAAFRDRYVLPRVVRRHPGYLMIVVYVDPNQHFFAREEYVLGQSPPAGGTRYARAIIFGPRRVGWWGLETRVLNYLPVIGDMEPGGDDSYLRTEAMCELIADYVLSNDLEFFSGHAAGIRAGKYTGHAISWGGIARTSVAGLVVLIGLTTLALMPRWNQRRLIAFDIKWCVNCRYPREGITADRCPECGAVYLTPPSAPESARAT